MDKQTYAQRVQALAEKFARNQLSRFDTFSEDQKKYAIDVKKEEACIAVAEMAEEIRGLLQYVTAWADCEIQDELIKRGLIPDNAQEGGQKAWNR